MVFQECSYLESYFFLCDLPGQVRLISLENNQWFLGHIAGSGLLHILVVILLTVS